MSTTNPRIPDDPTNVPPERQPTEKRNGDTPEAAAEGQDRCGELRCATPDEHEKAVG